MKALIFAAGRGERMRPLTDNVPKPLVKVAGKALIEYSIENLARSGFTDIVINVAYRGRQIIEHCGDGHRWGISIVYSNEGDTALETAGGIVKALSMLGNKAFIAVNSDVICDYPLAKLRQLNCDLAHLVMIPNPAHHPMGDFSLEQNGLLAEQGEEKFTFSGIGLYSPELFAGLKAEPLKLRPLFNAAMREQRISAELYLGRWHDIGSPKALAEFERNTAE